jgi:hypothetical protein
MLHNVAMNYSFTDGVLVEIDDAPLEFHHVIDTDWDYLRSAAGYISACYFQQNSHTIEVRVLRCNSSDTLSLWPYRYLSEIRIGDEIERVYMRDLPELLAFLRYMEPVVNLGREEEERARREEREKERQQRDSPIGPTQEMKEMQEKIETNRERDAEYQRKADELWAHRIAAERERRGTKA